MPYDVEVRNICNNDTTAATPISFSTKGCCVAPKHLHFSDITQNTATVHWDCDDAGSNIVIELVSFAPFSTQNIATLSYSAQNWTIPNLSTCTEYFVRIGTTCNDGSIIFSDVTPFTTAGCGNCSDIAYCTPTPPNNTYEWIESVTVGDNTYTTHQNLTGYTNIGSPEPPIILPKNYPIWFGVKPGYSSVAYIEHIWAMIDFNADGIFSETDGETIFDAGETNVATENSIILAASLDTGLVRMRVVMKYINQPNDLPCNGFQSGEIEDYCVRITDQQPCNSPTDLAVSDTSETALLLRWQTDGIATDFTIRYRHIDSTTWQTVAASGDSLWLEGLQTCAEYQVAVQSNCTPLPSYFSPIQTFASYCPNSQTADPSSTKSRCQIGPNPFRNQIWLQTAPETGQTSSVKITHADGKLVYQRAIKLLGSQSTRLTLPDNLPDGLYTISVTWDDGTTWHAKLMRL